MRSSSRKICTARLRPNPRARQERSVGGTGRTTHFELAHHPLGRLPERIENLLPLRSGARELLGLRAADDHVGGNANEIAREPRALGHDRAQQARRSPVREGCGLAVASAQPSRPAHRASGRGRRTRRRGTEVVVSVARIAGDDPRDLEAATSHPASDRTRCARCPETRPRRAARRVAARLPARPLRARRSPPARVATRL